MPAIEGVRDAAADVVWPSGRKKIDWIITRGLETVRAEVRQTDASDHPVLSAELQVEEMQFD